MESSNAAAGPTRPLDVARLRLAQLPANTPLDDVFSLACELAARSLEVDRVGVWLFIEEKSALRCIRLFERPTNEFSSGTVLRLTDFPNYFASISLRKSVPAEVATSDPRTTELAAAYLMPLGITSMLDAGIFVDGDLVGVVCHEHIGPIREWTTEARDFAGSIADLLAARIQSAEARELRTAFRTQRERLTALEKSAALEQLAAGVAHDFRNLLTVIVGYSDELSRRPDMPADAIKQCREILAAAEHGAELVRELLEFAKPNDRSPKVLNLLDATSEFMPVLRSAIGPHHQLKFIRPETVGQVLLDKMQYKQVLLNLVTNARDAMSEGGSIELRLRPVKLTGGIGQSGHFVMLEVADRGVGMDELTRKRVFEPFFTTRSKGTGLGLAIVHQIVDRAGGFINIESAPQGGTNFRVFFPRVGSSSGGTTELNVSPQMLTAFSV